MKKFDRMFVAVLLIIALLFIVADGYLLGDDRFYHGRPYRVEINRLVHEIHEKGYDDLDLSGCTYVTKVIKQEAESEGFFASDSDYMICEIDGKRYRFEYTYVLNHSGKDIVLLVNIILGIMTLIVIAILAYIRWEVLRPFQKMTELPYQLSRGNLTVPVKENKSRLFGKFLWGMDMLRENLEDAKQRELELQREKKTLLLSLSHDIKTPLSAIKLYAKALSQKLYTDEKKQEEIAEKINGKADEIEAFVSQITQASREDFLNFEVEMDEFYLSGLLDEICDYYSEKLALVKIGFTVGEYSDCLLRGDFDRSVEVLQNIMENAIKYGDGEKIEIRVSEEEGCELISIKNSGCSLDEKELSNIFNSFWRGSNVGTSAGNGLGLYICRQLMHKMEGDIFAEALEGWMCVTVVFVK